MLATLMAIALWAAVTPRAVAEPTVDRVAGQNRYETAVEISKRYFSPGVSVVYVASGEDYPDALSAGPVAAAHGAPVLLTRKDFLPGGTATELDRLRPGQIVLVGGESAVSETVRTALGAHTLGGVTRIAGADRWGTSAALSASTFAPGVAVVYLALGRNQFADALSGAAAAAKQNAPILLVDAGSIAAPVGAELDRLNPDRIVLLGGTSSVHPEVETALDQAHYANSVQRIAGADRYATSALVSAAVFSPGLPQVLLATGEAFPDALAGGAAAGSVGAPVLLVRQACVPSPIGAERNRLTPGTVIVLGGEAAVSTAAANGQSCESLVVD